MEREAKRKIKQYDFRKITARIFILPFCLSLFISFSPLKSQDACAWDAMGAAAAKHAWEQLQKTIDGISLASIKQTAMQMLLEEVNKLVDETFETGEKIIRDWDDYLKTTPERQSKKLMNDYLSQITQGRDSSRYRNLDISQILSYSKNYEGFGGINEYQFALIQRAKAEEDAGAYAMADGLNRMIANDKYSNDLKAISEEVIKESDTTTPPEIDCSGCEGLGSNFSFGLMWKCTSNWCYKPTAKASLASIYDKMSAEQKEQQKLKATASGFLPSTDKSGQVLTPAGTVENITNKAQTLGMDIMAKANSMPEVISAAVINAVNRSIKQGIGAVKARAKRELSNVRQEMTNKVKSQTQQIGPRAVFKNDRTY